MSNGRDLNDAYNNAYKYYDQFENEQDLNWFEKYQGNTSDALLNTLDAMEDGEEKDWLKNYSTQVYWQELSDMDVGAAKENSQRMHTLLEQAKQYDKPFRHDMADVWLKQNSDYKSLDELKRAVSRADQKITMAERYQTNEANRKKFEQVTKKADFAVKSAYDPANTDIGYRYVNGDDWERYLIEQQHGQYAQEFGHHGYGDLNDDEKNIYNYYINTGDRESAAQYLKHIEEDIQTREGEAADAYMDMLAEDHPWGKMVRYPYMAVVGLDQHESGMRGLGNMIAGSTDYVPATSTQVAGELVREDIAEDGPKLPQWMGGGSMGQMVGDAISTSANMAPSILLSSVLGLLNPTLGAGAAKLSLGQTAGKLMMSGGAAGSGYQEMINAGYTKDQARLYGLGVGSAEYILESMLGGITALGGSHSLNAALTKWISNVDSAIANVAVRLAGAGLGEFSEEFIQEYVGNWLKSEITQENFETKPADALYSGLLGFITGGIFEGPGIVGDTMNQSRQGRQVLKAEGVDALTQLGKASISQDTKNLAARISDQSTPYAVGNLVRQVQPEVARQNAGDISTSLTKKGMPKKAADQYGEIITYMLENGSDTEVQRLAMESDPIVGQTIREIQLPASPVRQRMQQMNMALGKSPTIGKVAAAYGKQADTVKATYIDGQDVDTFNVEFNAAHTMGRMGGNVNALEQVAPNLQPSQRQIAYDLGREAVALEKDAANKRTGRESMVRMLNEDGSVGDRVIVTGIASRDGDVVSYTLDNGQTVTEDQLSFSGDQLVLDAVKDMDVDTANTLIRGNNTLNVADAVVAQGIEDAYRHGSYGYSMERLSKDSYAAGKLTEEMRIAAYNAGKSSPRTAPKAAPAAKVSTRGSKPGVYFDAGEGRVSAYSGKGLDAKRKAAVQYAHILRSMDIGGDIYFFESYVNQNNQRVYLDQDGNEQEAPNGWYDRDDGSIHIDLNAGGEGKGYTLFTMSHELTHFIEQWSPEKYQTLANFLIENYEKGRSVDELVKIKQVAMAAGRGKPVSYEEAYSEVIADSMEAMLSDGNVARKLRELKAQDQGLFAKMKEFFNNLVQKISEVYSKLVPESEEGKMVLEMKDQVEQIQQLFAEALAEAGENLQKADVQKNTAHDERQFSDRKRKPEKITMSMTDSERAEILKDKVIVAEVYDGQADKAITDSKQSLESHKDTLIKSALVKIGEEFGVFTDYSISDVDVDIRLSRGNLKESISKEVDPVQIAKLLPVLKTAVENAIGIECHANRYFYDNNTVMFENMIGGYVDGEYFVPVRFGLKHSIAGKATLYLIVDQQKIEIKKIKAEVAKATVMQKHQADNASRSAFNISLASVVPFVNGKDLLRYLPDNMLTAKQKEAKWDAIAETVIYTNEKNDRHYVECIRKGNLTGARQMVTQAAKMAGYSRLFFHGAKKGGGFTRFREWSYFTENKRYAERYAQRDNPSSMYTVYGKMEKPFDTRDSKAKAIFENIRNEYGLSELQDTGLPDWTDGYDITDYIDENNLDYDGVILDEGGDMVDGKPVSRGLSYVIRNAEQVKSADVVTYDDDGNIIPISKRFDATNNDIRYQDRPTASVTNRTLLANALESTAQHELEVKRIREYKEQIGFLEEQEAKLAELRRQIRELSFAKGKQDTKKLSELRDEVTKTANRIDTYDRKLLKLEATAPLQRVLERERKKAKEETRQRDQEILKRHQEGRNKTAVRHKIQKVVGELNKLLLHGDKKNHVPENMKKAVADALALVNMDTVGAEERAAKYRDLIAKETDQDKIDAYTLTMENILRKGEQMGQRLKDLQAAYAEISKSDDPDIANAYDPVIAGNLQELSQTIGDTALKDMTMEQLQDVYDMFTMVLTRVRDANKSFADARNKSIAERASGVVREIRAAGGEKKVRISQLDPVRKFFWNNLKSVYAFEAIGSESLTEAYNMVRKGEDTWAVDVSDARNYYLERAKKYGYHSWDFEKTQEFESASGQRFELTLGHILSLYAYSRRKQAHEHLRLGGFVFDSNVESTAYTDNGKELKKYDPRKLLKHAVKYKVNTAEAHQIDPETLTEIIGTLTPEQLSFVEEMQAYLSDTMGAKGNEVSMQMYGIKLFKEKFYFPLKSAKQFLFEQNEVSGEVRIKNSGFTNKLVANANNPVILTDFMEVWANHVNDMSMYHAFVLPLEDFNRIFNYNSPKKENVPPVSVKGTLQSAYSPAAVSYVKNLITDLNGGARTDATTDPINKMMGVFKKGAVFASASVVIQQPSAIARAAAVIDLKWFAGAKVGGEKHKETWEEVKRYAPVAIIKEMGYFDTNMGRSTVDYITGQEYEDLLEKAKAMVTDSAYRDEVLSRAPAYADEMAWCAIWNAVKRETRSKNPGMDTKSDIFLTKAGERFTEVIVKTQVYDSVLSRSANMRSKDTGMKMATAFMAEPTTAINMISDALLKGKRGDTKYCRTAIGAVLAAQMLNAFLVSWVYAARDDDDEKTYWEKYAASLVSSIQDGINPLSYIPFIRDGISIVKGYEVERSDMAVISDIWNGWQKLSREDVSPWEKVESFAGSLLQLFGLPVKNIMRDLRAVYQAFDTVVNGEEGTWTGMAYALSGEEPTSQMQLYRARRDGDTAHAARVEARYEDADAADAAVRSAIRQAYLDGEVDLLTARNHLINYGGMDVTDAHWQMDEWKHRKETGSSEGYGKYNRLYESVRSGENLDAVVAEYLKNGVTAQTLSSQITEEFKDAYIGTAEKEREGLRNNLISAIVAIGYDEERAHERIDDWEFESKYGFEYSDRRRAYLEGEITADELRKGLVEGKEMSAEDANGILESYDFEIEYGFAWSERKQAYLDDKISADELMDLLVEKNDYSAEDALYQVVAYQWAEEGYDDATVAAVREYVEHCEPVGVPRDIYLNIRKFSNNTENDVDSVTGEKIYYSAMKKVMAQIDSQPLSDDQKLAIARSIGWSEKNIKKYKPW